MKRSIYLRQSKPLIANILGVFIWLLMLVLLYEETAGLDQIITMLIIGIILLGYSISFEINADLKHRKHYKIFGITVFKRRLECIFPDYVTVFSARFKKDSEWGPVAAMGNQTREGNYVVRFFKGNSYFTVCKAKTFEAAKVEAIKLGELLNVELRLKNE